MFLSQLPEFNTVKFNDLYLKPKSVSEILGKCVRMVLLEDDNRELPLGRAGSSTLVKIADEYYAIVPRHTLGMKSGHLGEVPIIEKIRIHSIDEKLKNIPVDAVFYETSNFDEEFHDLLILHVHKEKLQNYDKPYFCQISPKIENFERSWCYGYPTELSKFDEYYDDFYQGNIGHIQMIMLTTDMTLDKTFKSHANYFSRYTYKDNGRNMDGMSGGAVFSAVKNADGFEVRLSGIILRAGKGHMYTIDIIYIHEMIMKTRR